MAPRVVDPRQLPQSPPRQGTHTTRPTGVRCTLTFRRPSRSLHADVVMCPSGPRAAATLWRILTGSMNTAKVALRRPCARVAPRRSPTGRWWSIVMAEPSPSTRSCCASSARLPRRCSQRDPYAATTVSRARCRAAGLVGAELGVLVMSPRCPQDAGTSTAGSVRGRVRAMRAFLTNDSAGSSLAGRSSARAGVQCWPFPGRLELSGQRQSDRLPARAVAQHLYPSLGTHRSARCR